MSVHLRVCLCVWVGVGSEPGSVEMMWREIRLVIQSLPFLLGPSLPNHRLTLLFPGPVCLRPWYKLPLHPNATCASALQMPPPHLSTLH